MVRTQQSQLTATGEQFWHRNPGIQGPSLDWSKERNTDLKLTLKQGSNTKKKDERKTNPKNLTPGPKEH